MLDLENEIEKLLSCTIYKDNLLQQFISEFKFGNSVDLKLFLMVVQEVKEDGVGVFTKNNKLKEDIVSKL